MNQFCSGIISKFRTSALAKDTLIITVWNTIGKTLGFFIPFFIAAWYGLDRSTDALFFTYGLILLVAGICAPVVESVIVPFIAEANARKEEVPGFIGGVILLSGLVLLILMSFMLIGIPWALPWLTNFDLETRTLIHDLLFDVSPLVLLVTWSSVLAGTMNAMKRFALPAASPFFRSIVNLAVMYFLKDKFGVHSIAYGYVAGECFRLAILTWATVKTRSIRFSLNLQNITRVVSFAKTASFQIVSMMMIGLNTMVDKTMASWLGEGAVSILHYADRLYMIPVTFLSAGFIVALLSHWSSRYYEDGADRLLSDLRRNIRWIAVFSVPLSCALILLHRPIVQLGFGYGAFDVEKIPELGWVWVGYLAGFAPYVFTQMYVRGLLVLKNTKSLMYCSFYMSGFNVLLNFILMQFWGTMGIALSTSVVAVFTWLYLRRVFLKSTRAGV